MWNPSLSIPAKEFEFTDAEVARIKSGDRDVGLVTAPPPTGAGWNHW